MHTGRMAQEHEGRGQGVVCTSQETIKIDSNSPEAKREAWNRFSLIVLERSRPANTLISDF